MTLLVGNSETGFTTAGTTTAKLARAFAFTGSETGLLEELQLRTNANANTGVTSVRLGVLVDNAGAPGNLIQEGVYTGTPGTNSWITVTGLDIPILKNAKYWLVVLSIGGSLHYNSHGAGGSANWCQANVEKIALYECGDTIWEAPHAEGPVGFQGLGRAGVGAERKVMFGIYGGETNHGHTEWAAHRICVGRGAPGLDADYATTTPAEVSASVGAALAAGISVPLVIINTEDSLLLTESIAATYAEKAAAIIERVTTDHPTVKTFELINEPYSKGPHERSNASSYAKIILATYEEVSNKGITGVTLLVATYGTYRKVNGAGEYTNEWSDVHFGGGWVADILSAQPALKAAGAHPITGWTSHPYGQPAEITSEVIYGFLTVVANRETVKRNGGSGYNNWWITEVGFKITEVSEPVQSELLQEDAEQAQLLGEAGWLKAFIVYDDSPTAPYNIYGKAAGTMYQNFASERGLVPPVAFAAHLSVTSTLTAKLASARPFSTHFATLSALAATLTTGHPWSGATKKWEEDNFAWSEVDSKTEY